MTRLRRNVCIAIILCIIGWYSGDSIKHWPLIIIFGIFYSMTLEYAYHKVVLHGNNEYFGPAHREHHRKYRGNNLRVRKEDATDINESSHVFPLAWLCQWAVLDIIFGSVPAIFVSTICVYYIWYEISHWATHVVDNPIDKFMDRIPGVREVWLAQRVHHLEHHTNPMTNYNFTWPFIGDKL